MQLVPVSTNACELNLHPSWRLFLSALTFVSYTCTRDDVSIYLH